MKIGVVGKGGSGKTTLSWLSALTAQAAGHDVYALDADFNQHLSAQFGVNRDSITPLSGGRGMLVGHVMGTRADISVDEFKKTTKPAAGSRLLRLDREDPFLTNYIYTSASGVKLLRIGEFGPEDKGQHCYHGLTAVADILLSHLEPLTHGQTLIVDFTAGVDPFASPITENFDAFVLAVEPTLKGVEVARQWRQLLGNNSAPMHVMVNKVQAHSEVDWVRQQLPNEQMAGCLHQEPALRRAERGEIVSLADLLEVNRQALLSLWTDIRTPVVDMNYRAA